MTETAAPTALRERRRRQTEREIADAALDLFEERGVDGTTVDDIARAAGVSPRTVFRYFATKERAALVPHVELEERVEAMLAGLTADRPLLDQLEEVWNEVLRALADDAGRDSEAGALLLRVRRLMRAEPTLRLAAVALDEERVDALVAHVLDVTGAADDLAARVVIEAGSVAVRVSLDRWADARDAGRPLDLLATYAEASRVLRSLGAPAAGTAVL